MNRSFSWVLSEVSSLNLDCKFLWVFNLCQDCHLNQRRFLILIPFWYCFYKEYLITCVTHSLCERETGKFMRTYTHSDSNWLLLKWLKYVYRDVEFRLSGLYWLVLPHEIVHFIDFKVLCIQNDYFFDLVYVITPCIRSKWEKKIVFLQQQSFCLFYTFLLSKYL